MSPYTILNWCQGFKKQKIMFANQLGQKNIGHQDFNQDKDLKIEDLPIHTMAKDLEEIEHPSKKIDVSNALQDDFATKKPANINLTDKQKTSPFLSSAPINEPKTQPQLESLQPKKEKPETHSFFGSLFSSHSAEQKAEKEKKAAAEKQMAQQKEEERKLLEQKAAEAQRAEAKKIAEQKAEEKRLMEQKIIAEKKLAEQRDAEEKMRKYQESETPKAVGTERRNTSNLGKSVAIIIIVLVILIGGAGAYYFIATKQKTSNITVTEPIVEPTPEPTPKPEPEPIVKPVPTPQFSTDKPNYLALNTSSATTAAATIKDTLNKYSQDVTTAAVTTPIEFIVVDSKNNPLTFTNFASLAGIALPAGILSDLDKNFSLFMFNDNANTRIGLAIDTKNASALKSLLAKEEPNLAKDLAPILLSSNYTLANTAFGKSSYAGMDIKYQNIVSPEDLSIDYTVNTKQWLIGTTKMTLRSIIDYMNNSTVSSSSAASAPATPSQ